MLINTEPTTGTPLASRQNPGTTAGTTASQNSSATSDASAVSQLDPSLQRLAGLSSGAQEAQWEIHDQQGAGEAVESLRQSMLVHPGTVMAAQANQSSRNVLSLLQSSD